MNKPVMCNECKHFKSDMLPWCMKYSAPVMATIKENNLVVGKAARCVRENGGEGKEARHEE